VNCEEILVLMMGYIDDELSPSDRDLVEKHLAACPDCARQLEAYRRLGDTLSSLSFVEPSDVVTDTFCRSFYNRVERLTGWLLAGLGVLLLVVYGLYEFLTAPNVDSLVKIGVVALFLGALLLLISVWRLRRRLARVDKYRNVNR